MAARQIRRSGLILLMIGGALAAGVVATSRGQRPTGSARDRLAQALNAEDLDAVRLAVAAGISAMGDEAGIPEVADQYQPVPASAQPLTAVEARAALATIPDRAERLRWWKIGLDPQKLGHALREPAAIVACCLAVRRANAEEGERALELAREAGDFLVWAQDQAGSGGFPFPAARGFKHDNAFVTAERYLVKAQREGRLDKVVRNGWAFEDAGEGGLQFDNAEAGVAIFDLQRATGDERYLKSAIRSADWALSRPLVTNWNYNSFSVYLLARAHEATGEPKYLAAATKKARLGVIPGQLTAGPRAGRWADPHNARPPYHYIMLRALAALAGQMPADDPHRGEVLASLKLGLLARNREIVERGVMNKDKAFETLLLVNRRFAADPEFLRSTRSQEALEILRRLAGEQHRRGSSPLGPREWGQLLESTVAGDLGRVMKLDLADPAGKSHALADCREAKAIVLVFLGTECPVSNGYAPELARLAKRYSAEGVRFFGIHADSDVTAESAATHAKEYGLPFTILLDPEQKLAGEARATTMPEAVVLKADGQIRYRGRIDNRYTAEGKRRDQVSVHNLAAALDAVLAGKAVAETEVPALGCPLPKRPQG